MWLVNHNMIKVTFGKSHIDDKNGLCFLAFLFKSFWHVQGIVVVWCHLECNTEVHVVESNGHYLQIVDEVDAMLFRIIITEWLR